MRLLRVISNFPSRHAISATTAVLVAMLINMFQPFEQQPWIVIAALLVSQTTRGTPIKQSLYYACLILIGFIIASELIYFVPSSFIVLNLAMCIYIVAGLVVFYNRPLQDTVYFTILLLPLIFLIRCLYPAMDMMLVVKSVIDILMGAGIGMLCNYVILPVQPYQEFVTGVMPTIKALKKNLAHVKDEGEVKFDSYLQDSNTSYPEWIYEPGFNPGLRSGYRFFLINLERICELMVSLNYYIKMGVKNNCSDEMLSQINVVVNETITLIDALMDKLSGRTDLRVDANFVHDIERLEELAQDKFPGRLDVLHYQEERVQLVAFIRDLKDMRNLLLQLALAVP